MVQVEVVGERKTNWWFVVAGVLLVLLAVGTFAHPALFLELFTIWAGAGFLVAGVAGAVTYFQHRGFSRSAYSLFMAFLDALVGVLMLMHPVALAPVVPWFLGAAFIVCGLAAIIGTASLGRYLPESRPFMVISGALTLVVGVMFIIWPTSLSIWVSAFAAVRGITLITVGFMART